MTNTPQHPKELLAPAGDINAGYAALSYGADAVYLGLPKFSARATAENFTPDQLNHFTGYAHSLGKKVFVTLNTLIKEDELPAILTELQICKDCAVDAIILQDLGLVNLIKQRFPTLEMHASTQMAVHNKAGALALQKLGFTRIVLARELTLPEIQDISSIKGLETEVFIHGALCYSYSGLCLFSSLCFAKSANRGKCLYPCRSLFKNEKGKDAHLFSMKDLALEQDILSLPATSLKIEGRKKSALYVAAVTSYYRDILDGKPADPTKAENIKQIFARPWTKFHFGGKNKEVVDRDFVGHRGLPIGKVESIHKDKLGFTTTHKIGRHDGIQIEVKGSEKPFGFAADEMKVDGKSVYEAAAGTRLELRLPKDAPIIKGGEPIFLASASEIKGGYKFTKPNPSLFKTFPKIDVALTVTPTALTLISGVYKAHTDDTFSPAKNPEKNLASIKEVFTKTGAYNFTLGNLTINNKDNLFVPASVLNDLRRKLYEQIAIAEDAPTLPSISAPFPHSFKGFIVKTDNLNTLASIALSEVTEIIYALSPSSDPEALATLPKDKVRLALPTVARNPNLFLALINNLYAKGYHKWEIGNWWGLSVLPQADLDLTFSETLYSLNSQSIEMAKRLGASRITFSPEDNLDNIQKLNLASPLTTCFIAYQNPPLFTSAVCIKDTPCAQCQGRTEWQTLKNNLGEFRVLTQNCQTFVFKREDLSLTTTAPHTGADFYRVDFMYKDYSPKEALAIFTAAQNFAPIKNTFEGNIGKDI